MKFKDKTVGFLKGIEEVIERLRSLNPLDQTLNSKEDSVCFRSRQRSLDFWVMRRHIHATLMLKSGVHPKVVSERLGHATVAFTLDTYSHVVPGLQEAAAKAFDESLKSITID